MGTSEQQVGVNKSYHSMDVNEIKTDIQQRLFQEEETLGIEISYPPMEVWSDAKIQSPEKIWDFSKGRYDHDNAHHSKIFGKDLDYPSSKVKMEMYEYGRNILLENGYSQINRNFFTRGGFRNNNFCYQDNCLHSYPLLGLGVSAGGRRLTAVRWVHLLKFLFLHL